MRAALLLAILIVVPLTSAQPAGPGGPSISILPAGGDLAATHQVLATNLPPNQQLVVALIDPAGNQLIIPTHSDGNGNLNIEIQPPGGLWMVGVYRVVLGSGRGPSISATFGASDGSAHLFVEPYLPSPTSAFNITGVGLPPNASLDVVLMLTGGQQGEQTLHVTTDAAGTFSTFIWPQQLGLPFFAAGNYRVLAPSMQLSEVFTVREHPISSAISVQDPVSPGRATEIDFQNYPSSRYLWAVYASADGHLAGEFLLGPTAANGSLQAQAQFPALPEGKYLFATPYDWGETSFIMLAATSTPTPTPTVTPTVLPSPTAVHHLKCRWKRTHKHGKKKKVCRS